MGSVEKHLADLNHQTIYKTAIGKFVVEVVDNNFDPIVSVSQHGGSKREFPLDRFGIYLADETGRFYSDVSNAEVPRSDINDLAVEAYLQADTEGKEAQ